MYIITILKKKWIKKLLLVIFYIAFHQPVYCWGFYAHRHINRHAVFLLPPQMLQLYKKHIHFLEEHAVDPDKRRYAVAAEGPRHYIDIDHYGPFPYSNLPRHWDSAVARFGSDSMTAYGIVPWWIITMQARLTKAFKEKNLHGILRTSAELGHYIGDAHVPLHASSNHNGQHTNQQGIHAFWESRIPELLAEKEWDFFIGHASYLPSVSTFIWQRIMESALAADTVLWVERLLHQQFSPIKYSFEERNGLITRQYSSFYSIEYNQRLNGMIERRMRQSIDAVASCWYTAWVNAGQPDLLFLTDEPWNDDLYHSFNKMDSAWLKTRAGLRMHE